MKTFSALLALCAGNSLFTGEFPSQRPVTRSFDLRLNKRLSTQSWGWWFETPSCPSWRHCNAFRSPDDAINWNGQRDLEKFRGTSNITIKWLTKQLRIYEVVQINNHSNRYICSLGLMVLKPEYYGFNRSILWLWMHSVCLCCDRLREIKQYLSNMRITLYTGLLICFWSNE